MRERYAGATVVLTHARRDDDDLASRLRAAGARVIELPCVRIERLADVSALARAIAPLGPRDWLAVTSPAGADAVARVGAPRSPVAAVGPSTAARLAEHGIAVAFVPSVATGACLARELPRGEVAVLARSDRALADAPRILRERGFDVREVVAYRAAPVADGDVAAVRAALAADGTVVIFVSSPSALEGLLGAVEPRLVARAQLVVSGPTTLAAVRARLGTRVTTTPRDEEVSHAAHD
ncbi:MAG TPA: uroporphyrinogen-III synthase [Candidatus Limnocylindria bacterium]|nr:uroporphyrinogen-III synthase [Candidatus Limnocylindria bacterium]